MRQHLGLWSRSESWCVPNSTNLQKLMRDNFWFYHYMPLFLYSQAWYARKLTFPPVMDIWSNDSVKFLPLNTTMTKQMAILCDLHVVLSSIPCHWFNDSRKEIIHILFNSLIAVRTWTVIGIQNHGVNEQPTHKWYSSTLISANFASWGSLFPKQLTPTLFFMFLCFMLQWREKQI